MQRTVAAASIVVLLVGVVTLFLARKKELAPPFLAATPAGGTDLQCGHFAVERASELCGVSVSREQLLRLLPVSPKGHSLLQLSEALNELGIQTEGRRASPLSLRELPTPYIAHLDLNHWTVVASVTPRSVVMFDEGGERRMIDVSEFRKRWSGVVLLIKQNAVATVRRPGPRARFATLILDNGTELPSESVQNYDFRVTNTGQTPLAIQSVQVDCSCASYTFPAQPIAPQETGIITLRYDLRGKFGSYQHSALVKTNDPENAAVRLNSFGTIAGTPAEKVEFDLGTLVLGQPMVKCRAISLAVRATSRFPSSPCRFQG
jgi:predicted double-glycine peptidase